MIQNPILTGFNPDPSIVRVGDDYYIATSTFEWYPADPPFARIWSTGGWRRGR
jgi:beta-xylosidase